MGNTTDPALGSIAAQLETSRNYDSPPLHLWHPPLSGDIPIHINAQGDWYHDGSKIAREALVRLFANILRRERDGEYYLVTPTEKWRIEVEQHALLVTDVDAFEVDGIQHLEATLNTGKRIQVSEQQPLFLDDESGEIAALRLPHGLTAMFTRAAWYRLVDMADIEHDFAVLKSGDSVFRLRTV
ncbi:MAG: DUF1285 domain-containing protein [Haliea sp.]|nr:DUF1285 domain-containing protein [Haliea sp.]